MISLIKPFLRAAQQGVHNMATYGCWSEKQVVKTLLDAAETSPLSVEQYTQAVIQHILGGGRVSASMENYADENYLIVQSTKGLPDGKLNLETIRTTPLRLFVENAAHVIAPCGNDNAVIGHLDGARMCFQNIYYSTPYVYEDQIDVLRKLGNDIAANALDEYLESAASVHFAKINGNMSKRAIAKFTDIAEETLQEFYDAIKAGQPAPAFKRECALA
ncbi:MAG: hypothetical protein V4621_06760 [Pseudomonadota bacterium]